MKNSIIVLFFFINVIAYLLIIVFISRYYKKQIEDKELEIIEMNKQLIDREDIIREKIFCITKLNEKLENLKDITYNENRRNKNGNKRNF